MDPLIQRFLDQGFAQSGTRLAQIGDAMAAGNTFVAELSRHIFLNGSAMAQAKAAQELSTSGLAGEILRERSAGTQPNASGGVKPAA